MLNLYPYQINVVAKIQLDMQYPGNSLVVMATGAGKSLIIAEIAKWLQQPILILQPSVEILKQNKEKLLNVVGKDEVGIYSASMGEKNIKRYTLATIGSVYRKPEFFKHFKLVIIDECHLVNHKKLSTMFMQFLKQIGSPKVVGLTATPYRLESWGERLGNGYVLSHTSTKMINRAMNPFWSRIISVINAGDLIRAGYLCQPTYIEKSLVSRSELKANVSHTDFDMIRFENSIETRYEEIMLEIIKIAYYHKHVLVFCSSVLQAEQLSEMIPNSCVVSAKTPKKLREKIIQDFKSGLIKVVFNVECLTTGFDFPSLDAIVVLRPTQSIRLHVQMLGRGVRKAEGKTTCDIIDFVGNVRALGKIENVQVKRLETGWNIVTDTGNWHGRELYAYAYQLG